MKESIFGFSLNRGDAQSDPERHRRYTELEAQMDACIAGDMVFTMIMTDPLANSYVYSPVEPPTADSQLIVEVYARSWDEDDELGLHDIKVHETVGGEEGYEGMRTSDLVQMETDVEAERVFHQVQKDKSDTHPSQFTKGMED
jgi:hypothetical protein